MTDRTPAEQAAEALREARQVLQAWTLRYDFIDEALATLTAEAASARDPDEIIGDAIAKANPAKWEDVPARVSPDREALFRHIDRLRDDLQRFSATRELTGFEILASTIADACDDLIRAPAPDREALARRLQRSVDADTYDCPHDDNDIEAAIAFLRLPAQAEVEAMARQILEIAYSIPRTDSQRMREAALPSIIALLRRLSSPVGEWRPIETAPQDGTPSLWVGRWKPYDILAGGQPCFMIFRWSSFDSSGDPKSEAWYSDHSLGTKPDHWHVEWTHWQPLPAPPQEKPT